MYRYIAEARSTCGTVNTRYYYVYSILLINNWWGAIQWLSPDSNHQSPSVIRLAEDYPALQVYVNGGQPHWYCSDITHAGLDMKLNG